MISTENIIHFDKSKSKFGIELEVTTLSAIRKIFPPIGQWPTYRHSFYIIFCVTKGKGKHFIDFDTVNLKAGDLLFLNKGCVHAFDTNKNLDGILLFFTKDFIDVNSNLGKIKYTQLFNPSLYTPIIDKTAANSQNLVGICNLILKEYQNDLNKNTVRILGNMLELLILKAEQAKNILTKNIQSKSFAEFEKLTALVDENCTKQRKVAFYANAMYCSTKKVNDLCRKYSNESAKRFIDNRVVLEMKRILSTKDIRINELCDVFNFDETTNLIKFFKKYTGKTPKQFSSN